MTYGCIAGRDGFDRLQRPGRPESPALAAAARGWGKRRLTFPDPRPARRWKHVLAAVAVSPTRDSLTQSRCVVHWNHRPATCELLETPGGREPIRAFLFLRRMALESRWSALRPDGDGGGPCPHLVSLTLNGYRA